MCRWLWHVSMFGQKARQSNQSARSALRRSRPTVDLETLVCWSRLLCVPLRRRRALQVTQYRAKSAWGCRGAKLLAIRNGLELSQEEMLERLDSPQRVLQSSISGYERGV